MKIQNNPRNHLAWKDGDLEFVKPYPEEVDLWDNGESKREDRIEIKYDSAIEGLERLYDCLKDIEHPSNCPWCGKVSWGTFFPGGDGLCFPDSEGEWKRHPDNVPFPRGGVMILGSDFWDENNYNKENMKDTPSENSGPTLKGLEKLFKLTRIKECFLTNAWPCLREGNNPIGPPPGARCLKFTDRCGEFFLYTYKIMQPRLIVPLGLWPTAFVAKYLSGCPKVWMGRGSRFEKSTWKRVDEEPVASIGNTVVVPIVRPSIPSNHRYRIECLNSLEREAALIRRIFSCR